MHLKVLTRYFNVLPLTEALQRLTSDSLPRRTVCITFDDGYRDNATVALPLLHRYGALATFFITTGYLDGGRMWNDTIVETLRATRAQTLDLSDLDLGTLTLASRQQRNNAIHKILLALKYLPPAERLERVAGLVRCADVDVLPDDLMMTSQQVRELHQAGMQIGAHTVSHPILTRLPIDVARTEIADGREQLQRLTGAPVDAFAYPNGRPSDDYDSQHVDAVRAAGFSVAVSTAPGYAHRGADPLQLPRIGPWDKNGWKFALRLAGSFYGAEPARAA